MDNVKIFGFGSMLIESPVDENEELFRLHVTELLAEIYNGRVPEWLVFNVGQRFERQGRFFREFLCPAGSVDGFIQMRAEQPGGVSRAIIIRGSRSNMPFCIEICAGVETEFRCDELRLVN